MWELCDVNSAALSPYSLVKLLCCCSFGGMWAGLRSQQQTHTQLGVWQIGTFDLDFVLSHNVKGEVSGQR